MADEKLEIKVFMRDLASKTLSSIDKGFKQVAKGGNILAKSLTSVQAKIGALGLAVSGGFLARDTFDTFKTFDDTLRAAGAVAGATKDEMKLLGDTAKEMGKTTRYSASQAADGLRLLGMAGFNVEQSTKALPGVLKLAAAGNLELGQAADIATNILAGFNLEVDQLASVNDVLVKTFTSSNSSLIELGEGFKYVGPIAAGVGADFEDLLAALGKLHDAGIKGSMSGTTLKNVIDALLNPTADEAKQMKALEERMGGVALQVTDSQGRFIGFTEIVKQLNKAGIDGIEALKLFGLRAGPGMAALLGVGTEKLEEFSNALRNAGYTSDEIADFMEAGIGGASREMAAAFEAVQIAVGEAFNQDMVEGIKIVRDWFLKLVETIKELQESGKLAEWAQTAKDSFELVWEISKRLGYFLDYLGKRIAAVALALTGDFKSAIQAVADSQDQLNKAIFGRTGDEALKPYKAAQGKIKDILGENAEAVYVWDEKQKKLVKTTNELYNEMQKTTKQLERQAIGRAKSLGGEGKTKVEAPEVASVEAQLKSDFSRLKSVIETEMSSLDAAYEVGTVSLEQYFKDRRDLIAEALEAEIEQYQRAIESETDPDKKLALQDKIFAAEKQFQQDMIDLELDRYNEQKKLDDQRLKEKQELLQKQQAIEQVFKDVEQRLAASEGAALEAQFQNEIAELQERQNKETQILEEGNATREQLNELHRQHELEADRVAEDQHRRLMEFRLQAAQEVFGGMADVFAQAYEMGGKQQKEFFYLSKAASIAQASMSMYEGIMKAWGQGGMYGAIGAAVVTAAGALNIAKIATTSLAEGGSVPGSSPHSKADNVPILATAGEFMQPVDSVNYYGTGIMEAIRKRAIPRNILSGYSLPTRRSFGRFAFATGGSIGSGPVLRNFEEKPKVELTNVNYTDRSEFMKFMQSPEGQAATLNVISNNREKVTRQLR